MVATYIGGYTTMSTLLAVIGLLVLIALLLIVVILKVSHLINLRLTEVDLSPIVNGISRLRVIMEKWERSAHEDAARNREEQALLWEAVRADARSRICAEVERSLQSFSMESERKFEMLTRALTISSTGIREELVARLGQFKSLVDTTVVVTQSIKERHTEVISKALRMLDLRIEEKHAFLLTEVNSKLAAFGRRMEQSSSGNAGIAVVDRDESLVSNGSNRPRVSQGESWLSETEVSESAETLCGTRDSWTANSSLARVPVFGREN
jgi:hypothetical protein